MSGHVDIVKLLLINKADFTLKTAGGETALKAAIQGGHSEIVELLKLAGAKE
jgi:ankyrin repeat protein